MWNMCWQEQLVQLLETAPLRNDPMRIAVLGVGQELRGDDGVGPLLARRLADRLDGGSPWLWVQDGGSLPENFTAPLRRFSPDVVLILDAAEMGQPPGEIGCFDWRAFSNGAACDRAGVTGSATHAFPLRALASYITAELGCRVAFLGIQPADISFTAPLSPAVQQAMDLVEPFLIQIFSIQPNPAHTRNRTGMEANGI